MILFSSQVYYEDLKFLLKSGRLLRALQGNVFSIIFLLWRNGFRGTNSKDSFRVFYTLFIHYIILYIRKTHKFFFLVVWPLRSAPPANFHIYYLYNINYLFFSFIKWKFAEKEEKYKNGCTSMFIVHYKYWK